MPGTIIQDMQKFADTYMEGFDIHNLPVGDRSEHIRHVPSINHGEALTQREHVSAIRKAKSEERLYTGQRLLAVIEYLDYYFQMNGFEPYVQESKSCCDLFGRSYQEQDVRPIQGPLDVPEIKLRIQLRDFLNLSGVRESEIKYTDGIYCHKQGLLLSNKVRHASKRDMILEIADIMDKTKEPKYVPDLYHKFHESQKGPYVIGCDGVQNHIQAIFDTDDDRHVAGCLEAIAMRGPVKPEQWSYLHWDVPKFDDKARAIAIIGSSVYVISPHYTTATPGMVLISSVPSPRGPARHRIGDDAPEPTA